MKKIVLYMYLYQFVPKSIMILGNMYGVHFNNMALKSGESYLLPPSFIS